MSFIVAASCCRECFKNKGFNCADNKVRVSQQFRDALEEALVNLDNEEITDEQYESLTALTTDLRLACKKCKGKSPIVAKKIEATVVRAANEGVAARKAQCRQSSISRKHKPLSNNKRLKRLGVKKEGNLFIIEKFTKG